MCCVVSISGVPPARFQEFVELTRSRTYARGEGLTGRIWELGEPVWIPDSRRIRVSSGVQRPDGLHGAFGFPIRL
jgi:hypothetical protein